MMSEHDGKKYQHGAEQTPKPSSGKQLKVLSTSLGIMLAGHLLLAPGIHAETANGTAPQLVEWSSDEVKAYFNPSIDWNIPVPFEQKEGQASPTPSATPASGGTSNGSAPVIIQNNGGFGGGFGWDDLLLYHMIFNRGSLYSSSNWVNSRPSYDYRTNTPYVPKTYSSGSFTNSPITKTPTTSSGTGSFTTNKSSSSSSSSSNTGSSSKSTSSSSGSIGGNSSGFSSSSSSGG